MKDKIVYLLGSGAMIEFGGPSTSRLTEGCKSIVLNSFAIGTIPLLDKTYGSGNYNFETIIASVEYLLDWAVSNESQGKTTNNTNVIASVLRPKIVSIDSENLWILYSELINFIIQEVNNYDYYIDNDNNQSLLRRYFLNIKKKRKIKIYSLNYDRLIPHVIRINEGVNRLEGVSDDRYYNYNIKRFVTSSLTYFNLHGSTYLKIKAPYQIVLSTTPERLEYPIQQLGGSPNDIKLFSPIITGYSKSSRVLSEPFNFGFASFMADCANCKKIVIAGYSLSDPHINLLLKKLIFDKDKCVDIVDYDSEHDYSKIETKLLANTKCLVNFKLTEYGARSQDGKIKIFLDGFVEYLRMER